MYWRKGQVVGVDPVRDPDQYGRHVLSGLAFGKEDEVVEAHPIAHRHHHHVLDVRVLVDVRLRLVGRRDLGGDASGQCPCPGKYTPDRAYPENPSQ